MKEDRLQHEAYKWYHNNHLDNLGLLFSVPNGGLRNPREAQKLKATGVVAGVSDLIFLWKKRAYFLELKTLKGRQSAAQKKWQSVVEKHGFDYFVIRDLNSFKEIINNIIKK